jgi:teichuronic acid biosynthesis glycosyltransferase TuaG
MEEIINKPLVSVIMPAYNASDYIQVAINSVIAQTFTNWELIIIDDGSTDITSEIIIKNSNQDQRIQYFFQENGKQGKARNLGISHAQGKYVAFLDSDDFWMPEKLAIQLEEIQGQNVDLVFSDSYIFNNENVSDRSRKMHTINQIFEGENALKLFFDSNRIPTLTVLAKKESILFVNGFTEKKEIPLAEDYHLWLKMLISGCVFYGSDKTLASYRVHSESSTSQDKLASKQIPEVFYDLLQNNPQLKQILISYLKKILQKQYNGRTFTKSDFYFMINENCRYLDKQFYAPFYKIINYFFGIKITKKVLNHVLNA